MLVMYAGRAVEAALPAGRVRCRPACPLRRPWSPPAHGLAGRGAQRARCATSRPAAPPGARPALTRHAAAAALTPNYACATRLPASGPASRQTRRVALPASYGGRPAVLGDRRRAALNGFYRAALPRLVAPPEACRGWRPTSASASGGPWAWWTVRLQQNTLSRCLSMHACRTELVDYGVRERRRCRAPERARCAPSAACRCCTRLYLARSPLMRIDRTLWARRCGGMLLGLDARDTDRRLRAAGGGGIVTTAWPIRTSSRADQRQRGDRRARHRRSSSCRRRMRPRRWTISIQARLPAEPAGTSRPQPGVLFHLLATSRWWP